MQNYFVGESALSKNVRERIAEYSQSDSPVLITGETGSGRESAAREIHIMSRRKDRNFVTVSCPCLPEQSMYNFLFGYPEGTFPRNHEKEAGLLKNAEGGTVYLDEIEGLTSSAQAGLLRCIENHETSRVGDSTEMIDVRIIAGTSCDLGKQTSHGEFNYDLFQRISSLHLRLPALRERTEDILLLWGHFAEHYKNPKKLSPEALQIFKEYKWPGNIQEFRHFVERLHETSAEMDSFIGLSDAVHIIDKHGMPRNINKSDNI